MDGLDWENLAGAANEESWGKDRKLSMWVVSGVKGGMSRRIGVCWRHGC